MYKKKYIVATRPSLLAYTQTEQTVDLLRAKHPEIMFEVVKFSTHGDMVTDKPLTAFGGTGLFVKELEQAILNGEADFAVHSLKDVPSIQAAEFTLAAFPLREDVRDLFLTRAGNTLESLPDNCVIGTGSPRRIVQLRELKKQAVFKDLRGNIDTRMKKLEEGQYDAIMLAAAGLRRLGKQPKPESFLDVSICLPAIGQGAIALECKSDDPATIALLRTINHEETEIAITAERSFMKTIGGGCKFPLAAYAKLSGNQVHLQVMLGNHHTQQMIHLQDSDSSDRAEILGNLLGDRMLAMAEKQGLKIEYE